MKLHRDAVLRILRDWPVARLVTNGAGGQPHVVPIVFWWDNDEVWTAVDGKPKASADLVRIKNVRRDPRVTLLIDHYDDDWSALWWVRLHGRAEVLEGVAQSEDSATAAALGGLHTKYPQYGETPLLRAGGVLLRIRIEGQKSWTASPEKS